MDLVGDFRHQHTSQGQPILQVAVDIDVESLTMLRHEVDAIVDGRRSLGDREIARLRRRGEAEEHKKHYG